MNKILDYTEVFSSRIPQYTVSQISKLLKESIEDKFNYIQIRGEISGYKSAPSQHLYFNLKDSNAVIKAVCWKGVAGNLNFQLADGLEVIASGRLSTYEGQSTYQIIIQKLEHTGSGTLLALLQKRKADLAAEGLFDSSRKRSLPMLPKVIGIITSPTGAVIKDMLHRIDNRMGIHVLIWPVLVQGTEAANQITSAIVGFNNLPQNMVKPDIIIVARGGGSVEDLWAFNEENVVRATANSSIPIVSAIGHETDVTLIDYASDLRAPTPTAAAEIAVPVKVDLLNDLQITNQRLKSSLIHFFKNAENNLVNYTSVLINFSQKLYDFEFKINQIDYNLRKSLYKFLFNKTSNFSNLCANFSKDFITHKISVLESDLSILTMRINNIIDNLLYKNANRLNELNKLLESFNYEKVLKRGFALIINDKGRIIKSKHSTPANRSFTIKFHDGEIKVFSSPTNVKLDSSKLSKSSHQIKLFD